MLIVVFIGHYMASSETYRLLLHQTPSFDVAEGKAQGEPGECWWGTNLSTLLLIWAIVSCPLCYSLKPCQSSAVWSQTHITTRVLKLGVGTLPALSALSCKNIFYYVSFPWSFSVMLTTCMVYPSCLVPWGWDNFCFQLVYWHWILKTFFSI